MKNINKYSIYRSFLLSLLYLGVVFWTATSSVYGQIPPKPNPVRLVNDYAGVFTAEQAMIMERDLIAFSDSTSNQITVVSVTDLAGYDAAEFAYKVGEDWGVGNKKYNNGIVILVKPKIGNEQGKVFIAPGYGLEAAIPDAICKRIIEEEMIPFFRNNDYYGGVNAAVDVLKKLSSGEISSDEYADGDFSYIAIGFVAILFLVVFISIFTKKKGNFNGNSGNKGDGAGVDPLLAFWLLSSANKSHSGSWGGFSGGSGGSSGGFGGFGGGSFGGGGAGGSW